MVAINQAWSVLGDPARRAEYDASIGLGAGGNGQAGGAAARSPGATTRPSAGATPYHGEHPPPALAAHPGCLGATAGFLPWVAVLAVLAAIFVFTAYAGSTDNDPPTSPSGRFGPDDDDDVPMVAVRDVRGSCIRLASGITSVVDCLTVPNEGVIVAQASVGAACPAGTNQWLVRQLDVLACTEPGSESRP
jgi:hypothetical protein